MSNHWGISSCSVTARRFRAQGNTHLTDGKMAGKKRSALSWLSNISELKVDAELPRPCRKMIVCVWGAVGGMMCDGGFKDMTAML